MKPTASKKITSIKQFNAYRKALEDKYDPKKLIVAVCGGNGCRAFGSEKVFNAFKDEIKTQDLEAKVDLKLTGCHGFCEQGAVVAIKPENIFYCQVGIKDVSEIVTETLAKGQVVERLLFTDPETKKKIEHTFDIPFYTKQTKLLTANVGSIDPTSIDDYILNGGYKAIVKVLDKMAPEEVIEEIKNSGLRGLGGGGFPAGRKWESCRKAKGDKKYVICNGDEGDPGAFMDGSILDGNPHSVIEGMMIAGFAIGSDEGYFYVRAEYPLAVKHIKIALAQAEELGLLGENILGTDFSFRLHLKEGAGAFVCGESTALVLSIEGKRGMPKALPRPRTTEVGLWDKPTLLNNVKTFSNIPNIINNGAEWFASRGTEKSKGTAIFSITGKVRNCGLVEVPMGITLQELVYDIGGGIKKKRKFKALQSGGPSGGCLPPHLLDMPVDFDSLFAAGSMMGSGGMVIMDDKTCMIEVARYFIDFSLRESCGKCVPCRVGNEILYNILTKIVEGKGEEGDIELLESLGQDIKDLAVCGLGQTSPNPVLTTIRHFRDEYEAHIKEKRCPASVCVALIKFEVDPDLCKKCGACAKVCASGAIEGKVKEIAKIDKSKCIKCRMCIEECQYMAIK